MWVPDILRWEDDLAQRDAIFGLAAARLDREEPFDAPTNVPVPRSPFFLRNALNLTLTDRLVYQAAVAVVASDARDPIPPKCFVRIPPDVVAPGPYGLFT